MMALYSLFCIELTVGEGDDQHDVSIFVRAENPDILNDVTRHIEGVSFCPTAEGVVDEGRVEFTIPQDRIALDQHLRQLVRGW